MLKRRLFIIVTIALMVTLASDAFADMGSSSFRLITSVFSGGGAAMSIVNFTTNSTLGQSSPLIKPDDPPYSFNYYLYGGFWCTLDALSFEAYEGDFDGDGDVEGSDLAVFAADFGRSNCCASPCQGGFDNDCAVNESDLGVFATDFCRGDCPMGP